MKKLIGIVTAICVVSGMLLSTTVSAAVANYKNNPMEPTGTGSNVTNYSFVCSALNLEGGTPTQGQTAAGNIIQSIKGENTLGIDGTGAASFRVKNYMTTGIMGLIDIYGPTCKVKAGYTYFKSAMMKMNDSNTDETNKTKSIWMFCEQGGTGFASKSEDFATNLASYVSGTQGIPVYDWGGAKANSIKFTINSTDWTRVTTSIYREAGSSVNGLVDRTGWVVWGKDWKNTIAMGDWEILMDDCYVLEVPNTALKSIVFPVLDGAAIDKSGTQSVGTTLSASCTRTYDVNPLVTPTVHYQWQNSTDGSSWTNISGATGATYDITSSDAGKYVRAAMSAVSVPKDASEQDLTAVTSNVKYSSSVSVPAPTYTVSFGSFSNATVKLDDADVTTGAVLNNLTGGLKTLTVTPDPGYDVSSVTIGGQSYVPNSSNQVAFTLADNVTINIATAVSAPSVMTKNLGTSTVVTVGGKLYTANVVYAKFSNVVPTWYGMVLQDTANAANRLELQAVANNDGAYAVKVYGDALNGTYTLQALIKYGENSEDSGDASTPFTVERPNN